MPTTKANLSEADRADLISHSQKYKVYPYRYRINKAINGTNFAKADASGTVKYFTMQLTAGEILPVVSFATSLIITPNTAVDIFGIAISYNSSLSLADNVNANRPDEEGTVIYQLLSNGGAINDFQVFYPVDWYMERGSILYMHVFAGNTIVAAASASMVGHIVHGTMPTGG